MSLMHNLPEELYVLIFQYSIDSVYDLLKIERVCKEFYRIANTKYLWYYLYKRIYPNWSHNIQFGYMKQPLIDWRKFLINLQRHQKQLYSTTVDPFFNQLDGYQVQEPMAYDIDPLTNTGLIAVSVYTVPEKRSKILFFDYPSYKLTAEYMICNYYPSYVFYHIGGIQSLTVNNENVRLFSIALSHWTEEDDSMHLWETVLIYRLYKEGRVECLANIDMTKHDLMGRDTFFFSADDPNLKVAEWLSLVNPKRGVDKQSLFLLMLGPKRYRYAGCGHVIQFDLDRPIVDPLQLNEAKKELSVFNDAEHICAIPLGAQVSCLIHFRDYPQLSHLVCTGNFEANEMSIYDWRFGVKVGAIACNDPHPWGFETLWTVPPPTCMKEWSMYGLRLVAVRDQENSFEVRWFDISGLLKVQWDPFRKEEEEEEYGREKEKEIDMPYVYSWWNHPKTDKLRRTVLDHVMPYTVHNLSHIGMLCVDKLDTSVEYMAYNILQTTLYLLTNNRKLLIVDIESGQIIKTLDVDASSDINVLGKDVVLVGERSLSLLRHE